MSQPLLARFVETCTWKSMLVPFQLSKKLLFINLGCNATETGGRTGTLIVAVLPSPLGSLTKTVNELVPMSALPGNPERLPSERTISQPGPLIFEKVNGVPLFGLVAWFVMVPE